RPANCRASPKETAATGFHRGGEARRQRGTIRAVASIYAEVVGSLSRSTACRPIFTLTRQAWVSEARMTSERPRLLLVGWVESRASLSGGFDSEQFRPAPRTSDPDEGTLVSSSGDPPTR